MATSVASAVTSAVWSSSSSSSAASTGVAVDPEVEEDRRLLSYLYLSFSTFSLLLSLTVIVSWLKFPSLRRQPPSSFVFCRSLADVLYSCQFIAFYTIAPASRPSYCLYFTPLFQFSLLASQCFYFTLSLDLLLSLRNPFVSLSSSPLYHCFSFFFALLTAILIPITDAQGYRPGMEVCWIKASDSSSLNVITWALFFIPTLLFYAFALGVLVFAGWRLKVGLRETFHVRVKVLRDATRYVVAFTVYWSVALAIYLAIWYKERDGVDLKTNFALYAAFAVTIVLRAVLDELAWLSSNGVWGLLLRWWEGQKEADVPASDINRALRWEVLAFTTRGIALAAQRQARYEQTRGLSTPVKPKRSHYPSSMTSSGPASNRHLQLRLASAAPLAPSSAAASAFSTPFIDVAPHVFSYLRSLWGLSTEAYLESIGGETAAMMEKYTEGRSAAFFYYSADGRFIVKTLTSSEAQLLLHILPSYVAHMASQPDSLLSRFVGLHRLQLYSVTLRFVVMQSVFLTPLTIDERYDLKGSSVDRHTGRAGRKQGKVLKDSDLYSNLILAPEDRSQFLVQCDIDSHFLMRHAICDYSLLLGIHYTRHKVGVSTDVEVLSAPSSPSRASGATNEVSWTRFQRDDGGLRATTIRGPSKYFLGLIDVLQAWDLKKRLERWWKVQVRRMAPEGISAMAPEQYRARFLRAMESITEEEEEVRGWGNTKAEVSNRDMGAGEDAKQRNGSQGRGRRADVEVKSDPVHLDTLQQRLVEAGSVSDEEERDEFDDGEEDEQEEEVEIDEDAEENKEEEDEVG